MSRYDLGVGVDWDLRPVSHDGVAKLFEEHLPGYSEAEVAEHLGVSATTICKWLREGVSSMWAAILRLFWLYPYRDWSTLDLAAEEVDAVFVEVFDGDVERMSQALGYDGTHGRRDQWYRKWRKHGAPGAQGAGRLLHWALYGERPLYTLLRPMRQWSAVQVKDLLRSLTGCDVPGAQAKCLGLPCSLLYSARSRGLSHGSLVQHILRLSKLVPSEVVAWGEDAPLLVLRKWIAHHGSATRAADVLGLHRSTFDVWLRRGHVPAFKGGAPLLRIVVHDLETRGLLTHLEAPMPSSVEQRQEHFRETVRARRELGFDPRPVSGERFLRWRHELGLTIPECAEYLGWPQRTVERMGRGQASDHWAWRARFALWRLKRDNPELDVSDTETSSTQVRQLAEQLGGLGVTARAFWLKPGTVYKSWAQRGVPASSGYGRLVQIALQRMEESA